MIQNYVIISTYLENKLVYLTDINPNSEPIWSENTDNVLLFGDHRTAEVVGNSLGTIYYCFIDYKLPINE